MTKQTTIVVIGSLRVNYLHLQNLDKSILLHAGVSKTCWMYGKQWRPLSDAGFYIYTVFQSILWPI